MLSYIEGAADSLSLSVQDQMIAMKMIIVVEYTRVRGDFKMLGTGAIEIKPICLPAGSHENFKIG